MTLMLSSLQIDLTSLWPWWLSSMLKVTVWLAAAWVVDMAARHRSASLRHVLAITTVCGVPLIFLLNLSPVPESAGWQPLKPLLGDEMAFVIPVVQSRGPSEAADVNNTRVEPSVRRTRDWGPSIVGFWLLGGLVCALRLGLKCRIPRVATEAPAADPGDSLVSALRVECARLGLRRAPTLRLAAGALPMTFGLRRPSVLLPTGAGSWPPEKLAAVIRHELAHLRRGDIWWTLVSEMALLPLWPHPLARPLRRRIAHLREEACDDAVVMSGLAGHDYAEHLVSLLPGVGQSRFSLALPAVGQSGWPRRFRRLLDPAVTRRPSPLWRIGLLAGVSVGLLSAGTLLVSCAGHGPPAPAASMQAFAEKDPEHFPDVRRGAKRLRIRLKVVEIHQQHINEASTSPLLAAALANPATILSPEEGWQLFNPKRKGIDILSTPTVTARAGQQAKVEILQDFPFESEWLRDDKTGKFTVSKTETTQIGISIPITARPTANPRRIHVDLEPMIKEFDGFRRDLPYHLVQPEFMTRQRHFAGPVENGSYIIIGRRENVQEIEDVLPILGEIPLLGRLFRVARKQSFWSLAAVQVSVSEVPE